MFRHNDEDRSAADIDKIKAYEETAKADPKGYTRKVITAAVAGYAAPVGFIIVLLAIVAAGILHIATGGSGAAAVGKLTLAVGVLIFMVGKSMMVKFDPPEARRLKQEDAPALFDEVDAIRKKLGGPRIHEMYLDNRLNAAIEQAPRFGLFGGHINRLIIGLPLMQALSPAEFRAVIGHEYGHLAGSHGKTGAWIYRTRAMWHRLDGELENVSGWLYAPLRFFIHRFSPWFDRLSFPLARANEFEADKAGAAVADPQTAADALVRVTLAARHLDDVFWPKVWKRSLTAPAPNVSPFSAMEKSFRGMPAWPQKKEWVRDALRVQTDFSDTHPALNDRITALGAKPRLRKGETFAAQAMFGEAYEKIRKEFDAAWKVTARADWNAQYSHAETNRRRLAELDEKAKSAGRLSPKLALERAYLADAVMTADDALLRFKEAANWNPDHGEAWLSLGRLLSEKKDDRALACLKRASDINPQLKLPAADIRHRHYLAAGDAKKAQTAADEWRTERERHDTAMNEIYEIGKDTDFAPHGLGDDRLDPIVADLQKIDGIKEAFLLRTSSDLFDQFFGYHLVVCPKSENGFDYIAALEKLHALPFEGHLFFWFAIQDNRWLRKKAAKIDGATIDLSAITLKRAA